MTTTKEAAHAYAARGWHVFPTIPGTKLPATARGFKDATTDVDQICEWWDERPDYGVAIALGASGLFAVDIEVPDHEWVERMPETWSQFTASGGWHFLLCQPDGWEVPPVPVGFLAADVEIRGAGNYILAAPTPISSGNTKSGVAASYEVHVDVEPVDSPEWLLEAIRTCKVERERTRPVMRSVVGDHGNRSARDRIDELVGELQRAQPGTRNDMLIRTAASMGRVVAGGYASESEACGILESAISGWDNPKKNERCIARGVSYGMTLDPWYPDEAGDPLGDGFVDDLITVSEEQAAEDGLAVVTPGEVIPPAAPEAKDPRERDAARERIVDRLRDLSPVCDGFLEACEAASPYWQPGYAAGALVALGSVMAARRATWGGLTSSLFVLSVGSSATGKGGPQGVLADALRWWPDLEAAGQFSSWQSAFASHAEADTGLIWVIDEYESVLKAVLDSRSSESTKGLRGFLLRMATIGTRPYTIAKSLAQGGGSKTAHAPGMTIYGSATPAALFEALGRASVDDGLLPRHLITAEQSILPRRRWDMQRAELAPHVIQAIDACKETHKAWVAEFGSGAAGEVGDLLYDGGIEVAVDAVALTQLRAWGESIEEQRRGASSVPDAVLGRAVEQAQRVSISLAQLAQPGARRLRITQQIIDIALDIVLASVAELATYLEQHGGESQHERDAKRVLSVIRLMGTGGAWVTRGALRSKVRHVKARELDEVVAMLLETGEIDARKVDTGGRPRIEYRAI
jgi:hypothetical protein